MEKKINIAELLKDCPKGMELDCTIYNGKVCFEGIDDSNPARPIIKISVNLVHVERLDPWGQYSTRDYAKCVIFPKGKTTWEGFVPPCKFKDGDILATNLGSVFLLNTRLNTDERYGCFVGKGGDGSFHICVPFAYKECCGLATEDEKQKLFDAIKANGYKWNPETKALEKLIEPKFKVGDRIKKKGDARLISIKDVRDNYYIITIPDYFDNCYITDKLSFSNQGDYELVSNKFDITTLKPFDKVLVRGNVGQKWVIDFFGFMDKGYPFVCVGHYVSQCIPFEGNQHLLGTTDDCDEFYKTWE